VASVADAAGGTRTEVRPPPRRRLSSPIAHSALRLDSSPPSTTTPFTYPLFRVVEPNRHTRPSGHLVPDLYRAGCPFRGASRDSRRCRDLPATELAKLNRERQEQLQRLAATGEHVRVVAVAIEVSGAIAYGYLAAL
jgi:hypothetical protein